MKTAAFSDLKKSLVERTADELQSLIAAGKWKESLPSERQLAYELGISRSSLRIALSLLRRRGTIVSQPGKPTRLIKKRPASNQRMKRLGFLTSLPLTSFFSHYDYPAWYAAWNVQMKQRGYEIQLMHLPLLSGQSLERELSMIVDRFTVDAWVLHRLYPETHAWFSMHKIPAIVAGSRAVGVDLGFCDIDHKAVCMHAANTLFQLGHKHIAFLVSGTGRIGDVLGQEGFCEAALKYPEKRIASIFHHSDELASVRAALMKFFQAVPEITGMLVGHVPNVPLAMIMAAERGRSCPGKLSLIARTDHSCLDRLLPAPARYVTKDNVFAAGIARSLDATIQHATLDQRSTYILPEYKKGDSVRYMES